MDIFTTFFVPQIKLTPIFLLPQPIRIVLEATGTTFITAFLIHESWCFTYWLSYSLNSLGWSGKTIVVFGSNRQTSTKLDNEILDFQLYGIHSCYELLQTSGVCFVHLSPRQREKPSPIPDKYGSQCIFVCFSQLVSCTYSQANAQNCWWRVLNEDLQELTLI